ncbi:MAG: radical SAM protein [Desulfobacteraceae bacterium]|nr:MAG: radical SAM protein [Desulfobacteraceae bacterium]
MSDFVSSLSLPEFSLWEKIKDKRALISFELELTARCNNNCRHCYINLPAADIEAEHKELSLEEIRAIADEAVSMGALGCMLSGGEPLLRPDFFDIYLHLKKKGLLVSVFTNATLITKEHAKLFLQYPPRDLEVTVYGITAEVYERVTRSPGSFAKFRQGLDLLRGQGVKVRLKTMAMRSNLAELPEIRRFCLKHTAGGFRFDPFLHLRFDQDPERNREIKLERLSPEEVVALERSDRRRFNALTRMCRGLLDEVPSRTDCDHLFQCGAGNDGFTVGYNGLLRLCSSLWHPDCVYDLRKGNLREAWHDFIPRVREMRSGKRAFSEDCLSCSLINLCLWCPALAYLETGEMDVHIDFFCEMAHTRAQALQVQNRHY